MKKIVYLLVIPIGLMISDSSCKKSPNVNPNITQAVTYNKKVETIILDGFQRQYNIYLPSSYNALDSSTLLILLHGLNGNKDDNDTLSQYFTEFGHNVIGVSLQALPEQDVNLKNLASSFGLSLHAVWGKTGSSATYYSLGIPIPGSFELNKNVDDVKFLNTVIDNIKRNYSINTNQIFMMGVSLGGAMTYAYAFSTNPQCKAIAIFAGFIGRSLNTSGPFNVPTVHFHGTSDELVLYEGGGILNDNISNSVIDFIASKNIPRNAPLKMTIPHKNLDNKLVTKNDYVESPRVLFYKIDSATHSLKNIHDIDLIEATMEFFTEVITQGNISKK